MGSCFPFGDIEKCQSGFLSIKTKGEYVDLYKFSITLDKSFHSHLHLQLFSSDVFYNVLFFLGTLLFRPTSQSSFFCSSQPLSKTNANFSLALSQTQAQAQVMVSNIDGNRSNISIPNPLRFLILKI